jgi:hypothetical protein
MIDPNTLDLNALRQRVLAGETISPEIARAAIEALRQGRKTATTAAAVKGTSKKARVMSDDELMADFDAALTL